MPTRQSYSHRPSGFGIHADAICVISFLCVHHCDGYARDSSYYYYYDDDD
jgi:hypothetical protein